MASRRAPSAAVRRIVDLGCGPGTSTAILRARRSDASCLGVDSSAEMLEVVRRSDPSVQWVRDDIRTREPDGKVLFPFPRRLLIAYR